MPRWRALPDELDPQVREFASQLRRLVDRSGLSVAAVADRTGYSKTSWERYLNGRLLAPKGAIVALAEVTGTNPVHLTTMWELAERAWSRSEMRHDMTMEAIRISQARAALGELGPNPPKAKGGSRGKQAASKAAAAAPPKPAGAGAGAAGATPAAAPRRPAAGGDAPTSFLGRIPQKESSGSSGSAGSVGSAGSSGRSGTSSPAGPSAPRAGSWGVAPPPGLSGSAGSSGKPGQYGQSGYSPQSGQSSQSGYSAPTGPSGPAGGPPEDARPPRSGGSPDAPRRKRRVTMFLAGVVGALVMIAAALYLTDPGGGESGDDAKPSPTPSVSKNLPAGVECSGKDCTGQDPENMGCGGELATTTDSVTVGTALVEVRYSETCGAAWARITQATVGDEVQISSAGAAEQTGRVKVDTDTYTPMVAVKDAGDVKACATLASGEEGCTESAG
ncbi:XRE family transcriptional regulator [Streptomyces ureilyticus]|uniref:XRE family transcriptional regulator n=1 Tax=Streptomyces ureilyticus TaxID=1775131 RepID=A0ABX0DRV8_9ACTN|nr:XRE family transcriptional regulator [Streptomyces ureilyticus]NGO44418.1 XRE family transcriptional regulator [Streptomyces ureilyticus]